MKSASNTQAPRWILLATLVMIIGYGVWGMEQFAQQSGTRNTEAIKQAILRASTHCYALEGSYPPNLDYLEKNYGLILDHKRFSYVYEIFASNIRPEVEVLQWDTEIIQH